jgi:two-component system chemotaxis response regulator CheY
MSGARRVLIVEDSPAMRQLLAFALKKVPGVVVEQAGDGAAALRALSAAAAAARPFGLVLLDLNMPVMDGMKVLDRMREGGVLAGTTVAVVTTEEQVTVEEEARRRGARFFLRKPVNRKSVEKVVAEVFGPGVFGASDDEGAA